MKSFYLILLVLIFIDVIQISNCLNKSLVKDIDDGLIRTENFSVMKIIKRVNTVYTQGMFFDENNNILIESGGLYRQSSISKLKYPSQTQIKKRSLPNEYFAEGIAKCGQFIYQLTWQERKIIVYTYPDLEFKNELILDPLIAEGWGLSSTSNPNELIASDGSDKIYFLDCQNNLKVKRSIRVKKGNQPVYKLNALAYAKGHIWANVYFSNYIVRIDPDSGDVIKSYDMTPLVDYETNYNPSFTASFSQGDVLNGIAYDNVNDMFLVTGKRWAYYYETKFK